MIIVNQFEIGIIPMYRNLILTFLLSFSSIFGQQKYVTCTTWGELGNQIMMISAALAYAWDTNATPIFPDLATVKNCNIPTNAKDFFFRLNTKNIKGIEWTDRKLSFGYSPIEPALNVRLKPWGLDLGYFDHHQKRLQKLFAPTLGQKKQIKKKYPQIFTNRETVGVHIRLCANNVTPFCGFDYFQQAAKHFSQNALFFVGSNRIEWVKKHIKKLLPNRRIIFLEDNSHIMDFNTLRLCKHNITSASTFSFWVGYLNSNREKKVLAPSLWLKTTDPRTLQGWPGSGLPSRLYPKEWTIIKVPVSRAVPPDLLKFTSTSVNS